MADYNAGTASIKVKPDLSRFLETLKAELQKLDDDFEIHLKADTDGMKEEVDAELAEISDDATVTVEVEVDSADAEAEIDAIGDDKVIEIDVDADTAEAEAKIASIDDDKVIEIDVDADTSAANTKIATATRNRITQIFLNVNTQDVTNKIKSIRIPKFLSTKLDIDTKDAEKNVDNLKKKNDNAGRGKLQILGTAAAYGTLGTAAGGAIGPISAMASVLISASGVLATLPALAGAAGAGIATLGVGLSGIGKAFGAFGKTAGGAGGATAQAMQQAEDAVQSAQHGIVRAQRGIRDAERGVEQAQKSAKKAQEDLTEARKEATRTLEDMNDRLKDAALDEEGAVLAVARAQERLNEVRSDPKASNLDVAEADLAYRQAVDNLEDMRAEHNRLAEDTAKANAKGVEGSDAVVAASERVEDAAWDQLHAQEQLEEAHISMQDAQKQLAKAMADLAAGGVGAAAGVDQFAEALAALSPNAREFVLAVLGMKDQWTDLRLAVQDSLFEGLGADITRLGSQQLPVLKDGLVGIATELNGGVRESMKVFSTDSATQDFQTFLTNTQGLFAGLSRTAAPLSQIWIDFSTVGSQYLPALGNAVGALTEKWRDNIAAMRESGDLAKFFDNSIASMQQVGDAIGNVFGLLKGIGTAAATAGAPFLGHIGLAIEQLNQWTNSSEGQDTLVQFFTTLTNAAGALMPILGALGQGIIQGVAPIIEGLLVGAGPGLTELVNGLSLGLQALAPAAQPIGEAIGAIATAIAPILPVVGELIASIAGPLAEALGTMFTAMAPVIQQLAAQLQPVMQSLQPVFADLGQVLAGVVVQAMQTLAPHIPQIAQTFGELLQAVLPLLPELAKLAFEIITPFLPVIGQLIPLVLNIISIISDILPILIPLIQQNAAFAGALANVVAIVLEVIAVFVRLQTEVWATIVDFFSGLIQRVTNGGNDTIEKFTGIKDGIFGVFDKIYDSFHDIGTNIINGMWDGAKKKWNEFKSWLSRSAGGLTTPFGRWGGGNRREDGGVTAYADGDIRMSRQDAQIAPGGSYIVYAEDETEGEAFIPLAKSKRARSTQILAETARLMGYSVVQRDGSLVQRDGSSVAPLNTKFFANGGITVEELDDFARPIEGAPYVWGGVHWGDCSGAMSGIARFSVGMDPWGGRFATGNQREALSGMGFLPGHGGPGSLSIGWFNGGPYGGHTSGTLPSGVNIEMGGGRGNGQFGGRAAPADHPQYTDHAHLPASFFEPVDVSMQGAVDIRKGGSAKYLEEFRESEKSTPEAYEGGGAKSSGQKEVNSISDVFSTFASEFVKGQTQDFLKVVGAPDELPPIVKAARDLQNAVDKAGDAKDTKDAERAISGVAAAGVAAAAAGLPTQQVPGGALVDIKPHTVGVGADKGDIGHVYEPGKGAEQWRPMAIVAIDRVGGDSKNNAQVNAMISQIQSESGGDPNIAQQIVDVNGVGDAAGVGLLQIIPSTWRAHRDPELPDDRRHPFANMVGALRYYNARYGPDLTKMWGHGRGYANGGDVWGAGGSRQDLIPAMLSHGEHVTRAVSADAARPLLNAMNRDPNLAASLNNAFVGADKNAAGGGVVRQNVTHYHIETNSIDEGMRRAEMHEKHNAYAMLGA